MIESMAWVDKYRPKTLEQCFLPQKTYNELKRYLDKDNIPTLFLVGPSGIGKTTVAKVICEQGEYENMFINASLAGIDAVRSDIQNFSSSVSMNHKRKIIVLDEADGLTSAAQEALRGVINEFTNNVSFILTANFKNKIIEPLISRSVEIDFAFKHEELKNLAIGIYKFIKSRLNQENIEYQDSTIQNYVKQSILRSTDIRKILIEAQRLASTGKFVFSGNLNDNDNRYNQLLQLMSARDFDRVRQWVTDNSDVSNSTLVRLIYENHNKLKIVGNSLSSLIIILNEYQYKNSFVIDQEINNVAMIAEVMNIL